MMQFSVIKNWKKITQTEGNEDFTKLKSMQGLRVMVMFCIIGKHSAVKVMNIFVEDVEDIESVRLLTLWARENFECFFFQFMQNTYMQVTAALSVLVVNIFFMISTFLLANQIYTIFGRNGKFTRKDVWILMVNRYFR